MLVLGAITALCLMCGITTVPLDPLFLFFCIHGCSNIDVIGPALLTKWHPECKQIISDWIAAGPTGNAKMFQNYFTSYHDLQVHFLVLNMTCPNTVHHHHRLQGCRTMIKMSMMQWPCRCCSGWSSDQSLPITLKFKLSGIDLTCLVAMVSVSPKYVTVLPKTMYWFSPRSWNLYLVVVSPSSSRKKPQACFA